MIFVKQETALYELHNHQITFPIVAQGFLILVLSAGLVVCAYGFILQILWIGKPVMTFGEHELIYSVNLRNIISIPYYEIMDIKIKKIIGRGAANLLLIEKSDSTIDKVGLDRLDQSIDDIMAQFALKMPKLDLKNLIEE